MPRRGVSYLGCLLCEKQKEMMTGMRSVTKKLKAIKADPRKISTGYALGVFLGTTPFIGLKVFIALLITSLFKWSKISAVVGVYHINIITAPLFYGLSFVVGKSILGTDLMFAYPEQLSFSAIMSLFYANPSVFWSLMLGGLILGIPMSAGAYFFSMAVTGGKNYEKRDFEILKRKEIPGGQKTYTVITGASTGLGKEFAIACAERGRNLILVALPGRNLVLLGRVLEREYGIRAVVYETDLTDREAVYELASSILRNYRVDFLINNAGTGGTQVFEESSTRYLENIVSLNIMSLALLTRLFINELKSHEHAYILNVSSMAAFSPIPFKTIYPASKAFVANFSRSLRQELATTGVRVAVLHPGPILTNPDVALRIVRQGSAGKVGLLPAKEIAQLGIDGVISGREVIIPGIMNKMNRILIAIVPSGIRMNMLSRVISREIEEKERKAA